eukprot:m.51168 g.51168  ORF g.51168 m.51168 type:complete len:68 (-) comp48245_c0_seq1:352-555(-)
MLLFFCLSVVVVCVWVCWTCQQFFFLAFFPFPLPVALGRNKDNSHSESHRLPASHKHSSQQNFSLVA